MFWVKIQEVSSELKMDYLNYGYYYSLELS